MNTYIIMKLHDIRNALKDDASVSNGHIEKIIDELEMMKMEIEQHIQNMPKTTEYQTTLTASAEYAVKSLADIIELLYESEDSGKSEQEELLSEIMELIDTINY